MTTTPDHLVITSPAVHRLGVALQRLRNEQNALLHANRTLVDWGITSGSPEVFARMRAIESDALAIATRLHALGAHDQADEATKGWATIPAARRTTAQVAS